MALTKSKKLDVTEYNNLEETRLKTVDREEDFGIIFDNKFEEQLPASSRYVTEVFCTFFIIIIILCIFVQSR